MRKPRIYTSQTLKTGLIIQLEPQQSSHIARVLRLTNGAPLVLFNGDGTEFECCIEDANRKAASVSVNQQILANRESPLKTHIGLVVSKGDRFEYAIQKATELGVHRITPLFSERSEVRLKADRLQKKMEQWQAICISACEQCQRNEVPVIEPMESVTNWVTHQTEGLRLALHHRAAQKMASFEKPESVTFLIGPEGGLSEVEIDQAHNAGFHSSLIGPRVLRTETAPLVALSVVQQLWGDFGV